MDVSKKQLRASRDRHENSGEVDMSPNPILWDVEAFDLQLEEDAECLLGNLQDGDGEHSEALDIGLIKASFRSLLKWATQTLREQLAQARADTALLSSERNRLAREIDVAMHGEADAARQASLCDLVPLAQRIRQQLVQAEATLANAVTHVHGLRIERDSAREQFDRHVDWASEQIKETERQLAQMSDRAARLEQQLNQSACREASQEIKLAQVTLERDEISRRTVSWANAAQAAESALTAQREDLERYRASVREMVGAMRAYEMDVEEPAPYHHRDMMERAEALIACTPTKSAPSGGQS